MNRFLIVTGLPASGKSTIGRSIAAKLSLPFLDKDDLLESLFPTSGPYDSAQRHRLSRTADDMFRAQAMSSTGAVLASWWKHPRSPVDSGTPSDWLASLAGQIIEIHCRCDPVIAADRFLARQRHAGHLDALRSRDDLLAQFREQAVLGPLGVGALVEVASSESFDIDDAMRRIERALQPS